MKFIREKTVEQLTGLSRSSRWRLEREGKFPKRRRIGLSSVAWIEAEILQWIESRPQVTARAFPIKEGSHE